MKKYLIILLLFIGIIFQTQLFSYSGDLVGDTKCSEINKANRYQNLSPSIITKIDLIGDKINNKYTDKDNTYKEKIYNLYIKVLNQYLEKTQYSEVQKEVLLRIGDYFVCKKEDLELIKIVKQTIFETNIGIDSIIRKEAGLKDLIKNGNNWEITTIEPNAKLNSMEVELSTEVGKIYEVKIEVDKKIKLWFSDGAKSHETIDKLNQIITTNFKATVKNQKLWIQPQDYGTTIVSNFQVLEKKVILNDDDNNKIEEKTVDTVNNNDNSISFKTGTNNFVGKALPVKKFNVLDYGLKGDGKTDDTAALKKLAKNTNVTNWYFPKGYTFKLYRVAIPSHVNAVHGGANILISADGKPVFSDSYIGAFVAYMDRVKGPKSLIIDGLHFSIESGFKSHQNYGMITISNGGSSDGIEIRNCVFDGSNGELNAIKVFTKNDAIHSNMYIYNNKSFNNRGYFDIEFYHIGEPIFSGLPNLKVYNNNIFNSRGHGSISYVKSNSPGAEIYNNKIDSSKMAIEILSQNVKVYNNLLLNIRGQAFSIGGRTWEENVPFNWNIDTLIYNNHIEILKEGYFYTYSGHNAKIFNNYIKGDIVLRFQIDGSPLILPDFYDNTLVLTEGRFHYGFQMYSDIGGTIISGSFHDNDIYNTSTQGVYIANTKSNFNSDNNNIYMKNSNAICIKTTGLNINNNCTKGYTGKIPNSIEGAGLLK